MKLTIQDMKDVMSEADKRFEIHKEGDFEINLSVGNKITIINSRHDDHQWDYKIPFSYELPNSDISDVEVWWEERHPTTGRVHEPEYEQGHWIVTYQWKTSADCYFNMFVAVPKWAAS